MIGNQPEGCRVVRPPITECVDGDAGGLSSGQDEVHLRPACGVGSVADENHARDGVFGLALKDDIKT